MGGRGRQLAAPREGSSQQTVEVKVTSDMGKPVKGKNGVVGWMRDHGAVSKKVSYKVLIDCCFTSLLIAGVNFATAGFVIITSPLVILCRDST